MFAFIAGFSYVFIGQLGLSPTEYGLVFGVIVLGLVAGTLGTRLVVLGAIGSLVEHHVPGFAVIGLALPQTVLTLGGGIAMPATIAGAVMPNGHWAGAAAGLLGFA
jgi:DHA1 family bicyclomycin/chloramphenicol resistance-like MFS transporter